MPTRSPATARGPIPGDPFLLAGTHDLAAAGYLREEWFVSGSARSYAAPAPAPEDGRIDAEPAEAADFTTRLVVCRPEDPARFRGTLLLEWFNVTGGVDAAPDYLFLHRHLLRERMAWVGLSVQQAGIDGGGLVPGLPLKRADAARYAALSHPGDRFAFGIYGAVAQLLRRPGSGPLGDLVPERLIGIGESQSAGYLVTFANAVDPIERACDGYLIHGRPGAAAPLDGGYLRPARDGNVQNVGRNLTGTGHRIREDARVPVLTLNSETDIVALSAGRARQPDSDRFRSWEIAGAAHFDTYGLIASHADREGIPVEELAAQLAPRAEVMGMTAEACVNSGPQQHYVLNAAVSHLDRWLRDDTPPPRAPRLETRDDPELALVRDERGIARGGIRTPWVDAPSAALTGDPPGGDGFLFLFGTTRPFTEKTLAQLYPGGADEHRKRFEAATTAALDHGFLLADDADEIRALVRHGRQPSGWKTD